MAVPTVTVRVDWDNDGAFTQSIDTVRAIAPAGQGIDITRGRSVDFGTDATGAATFLLRNDDERYTPDRNWCDNPSFEAGVAGWSTLAVAGLTAASVDYATVRTATAGLVSVWRLGDTTITAADGKGANPGTYVAAPTQGVAGPLGDGVTAVTVNGTTQYVTVPDAATLDLGDTWSVELWLKGPSPGAVEQMLVNKGVGAYALKLDTSGRPQITRYGVANGKVSTVAVTDSLWHHVTATRSPGVEHIYVDGVNVSSGSVVGTAFGDTATALLIGAADTTPQAPYLGTLAEVAVYSTELSSATVTAHYAATWLQQFTDNAPSAGTKAGRVSLPATNNSGVTYPIPYAFRSGVTYAVSVYAKSMTGNLNVRAGLASAGTPADIASSGSNITTSWAAYTFTWTPSADRSDAVFFIRTTTAAAATLRIDAVQVNPGAAANTYIEAPTKGQLVPGRPVHIYATYSAVDYPQFYGFIERITPNPIDRTVAITCYDVLRRLSETDVVVAASSLVQRSARDFRREVLEDFERGSRNLLANPSFETDTTGWSVQTGTITRNATDAAPGAGSASGDFAWTSGTAMLWNVISLTPIVFPGQVYRFSVYLRVTGGTLAATIGIGEDAGISVFVSRSVTATTTWQRFTITYTAPTLRSAISAQMLRPFIRIASGTLRVDAAAFTRGQGLYPYADVGTGRWPNWCGNGSFDGGALNGWYDGFKNLIANPSFETDTTGWTGVARVVSDPYFGAAHATITGAGTVAVYAITGTFKSGVTYDFMLGTKDGTAPTEALTAVVRSAGTPADTSAAAQPVGATGTTASWIQSTATWTPSADRTDAEIRITKGGSAGTSKIDGVMVTRRDSALAAAPTSYADTGPGGGGSFVTTRTTSATAKYGSKSQQADTPATATAGRLYDFNHLGPVFVAGQPYTLSLWLRPTSNMPYKVGLGGNAGTGAFDEASATGTATANVWTQITVSWTPSANRSTAGILDVVAYVIQTDATARTFLIDGVRVIPGSSADGFEMTQWSLAAESDAYLTSASLSGSALGALNTINGLTLSRHWIEPTMASPWYRYLTSSRDDLATKTSAETFTDGISAMTAADIDRDSIVNIVPVAYSGGTEYYSDATSVATYGPRPSAGIGGTTYFPDRTIPDAVGPALVTRYKVPRARPVITVINRFPTQLQREVDDLITVSSTRALLTSQKYLIVRRDVSITDGGTKWESKLTLEEHAF